MASDSSCSLHTYGAKVDQIRAPIGAAVGPDEIEASLKSKNYKVITITHVDTSTGEHSFTVLCLCLVEAILLRRPLRRERNRRGSAQSVTRDIGR